MSLIIGSATIPPAHVINITETTAGIWIQGFISDEATKKTILRNLDLLKDGQIVNVRLPTDEGRIVTGPRRITEFSVRLNENENNRLEFGMILKQPT